MKQKDGGRKSCYWLQSFLCLSTAPYLISLWNPAYIKLGSHLYQMLCCYRWRDRDAAFKVTIDVHATGTLLNLETPMVRIKFFRKTISSQPGQATGILLGGKRATTCV